MALQAMIELIQTIQAPKARVQETQWGTFTYNEEVVILDKVSNLAAKINEMIKQLDTDLPFNENNLQQLLNTIHGTGDVAQ